MPPRLSAGTSGTSIVADTLTPVATVDSAVKGSKQNAPADLPVSGVGTLTVQEKRPNNTMTYIIIAVVAAALIAGIYLIRS